jgi:hypothetical protein
MKTSKDKLKLLEGDKQTQGNRIVALQGELVAEKKSLNDKLHAVQLANNDFKDDIKAITALRDQAVRDLKTLQTKYDAATTHGIPTDVVVSDITEVPVAVPKVPVHPVVDMKLDVPPSRAHASDKPADVVHDASFTSRSHASSSSSDTHDHEHVDDRLVMTLLHELRALVGPKFGLTDPDIYDALATLLAHFIEERHRFAVMHQIYPTEFRRDDGEYISNVIVQGRISRYLKERVYVSKANTESKEEVSDDWWFGGRSEKKAEGTERSARTQGGSGEKRLKGQRELIELGV